MLDSAWPTPRYIRVDEDSEEDEDKAAEVARSPSSCNLVLTTSIGFVNTHAEQAANALQTKDPYTDKIGA
jgi:hypothetical protein